MMRMRRIASGALLALAVCQGEAAGDDDTLIFLDPPNDATLRRTDFGGTAPLLPNAVLPDLQRVQLTGWSPQSPVDPFNGSPVGHAQAHVLRIDVVFTGLVNPPGPLGLGGQTYNPTLFGPSPVYGYIEFDIDRNRDTGGELPGPAIFRYLANVGRFGGLPEGSEGGLAARSFNECDFSFWSSPYYERSGKDFAIVLCGCSPVTIVSQSYPCDGVFSPGETWIVNGRFFQRSGGYAGASAVTDGSTPGAFDPPLNVRFSHSIAANTTTLTVLFALDPLGASMLTGQPVQPLDMRIAPPNHASIQEAAQDLINGARGFNGGSLSGPEFVLTDEWQTAEMRDVLDYTRWRASAIVGTTYAAPTGLFYAWTDVGFNCTRGDFDGNAVANLTDRVQVLAFIQQNDGGPNDADGVVNGSVAIGDFPQNFSAYDLQGDGRVNGADLAWFPGSPCQGDMDGDGRIQPNDIALFVQRWIADLSGGTHLSDINGDGSVAPDDIATFVQLWFACL